jgi:acetyl-CoA carboxylase biotin carboxyl carrier protein
MAQLEGVLEFMAAHGLEEFEYHNGDLHIRMKKAATAVARGSVEPAAVAPAHTPAAVPAAVPAGVSAAAEVAPPAAPAEELHTVKSPIVGTFYASPSPDAAPFVHVGDSVQQGQVVCIVEAMKLMNEIESDVAGEIVRVLVENGQPVEYGQGLFYIRTAHAGRSDQAGRPVKTKG